ncbi:hypothetical protein FACS1894125_4530 [Actinomycetota bacterium]|nr:hypothetical protein FACS1894125_4530 [Actinomycetota bacterium]
MIDGFENSGKHYKFEMTNEAQIDYDNIIDGMLSSPKTTQKYIDRFEAEVDAIIDILKDSPYIGRGLRDGDDNFRYRSVPGYDYAIYYEVIDDELEVLAFLFVPELAGQTTVVGLLNERLNLQKNKREDGATNG